MTMLFFRAVSWISPTAADKLEALWGHIQGVYLRLRAYYRETSLHDQIAASKQKIEELKERILRFRPQQEQAVFEKEQAMREIELLRETLESKEQLCLDHENRLAFLTSENSGLKKRVGELGDSLARLQYQLSLWEKEKANLMQEKGAAVHEIAMLRCTSRGMKQYEAISGLLKSLEQKVSAVTPPVSEENQGMIREESMKLLPLYQEHREDFHKELKKVIAELEPGKITGLLEGILRISQEEMGHVKE